jgi:hypothetical protein
MILSRYLYFVDDVFNTLERKIIDKSDFNEVLFWLSEIYYSGFKEELIEFIYYLYYKYYYIDYPYIERKLQNIRKKHELEIFINIIKNLYIKKASTKVSKILDAFSLSIYFSLKIELINKTSQIKCKKPKYKIKDNKKLEEIITNNNIEFIFDKKIKNIVKREIQELKHIIYSLLNKKGQLNNYIFFIINDKLDIDTIINILYILLGREKIKNYNKNEPCMKLKLLKLLSLYIIYNDNIEIQKCKKIYVKETKNEIEIFKKTNDKVDYLFDTLKQKRLYSIIKNENINNYEERKYIQYKGLWEYYIFGCPLWEERIKKYDIIKNPNYICYFDIDKENYETILFKDDDEEIKREMFYELFNYELQEQSIEVIEKAL